MIENRAIGSIFTLLYSKIAWNMLVERGAESYSARIERSPDNGLRIVGRREISRRACQISTGTEGIEIKRNTLSTLSLRSEGVWPKNVPRNRLLEAVHCLVSTRTTPSSVFPNDRGMRLSDATEGGIPERPSKYHPR